MRLDAQRDIRTHGQKGNWRFKGLLLAGLGEHSFDDVAKAWPTKPSEYRFLSSNDFYDADRESKRKVVVEEDTDEFHLLSDYAGDELDEADHGLHEAHLDKSIKHMLFSASTPEELDTLFREQLADVVAEGAQRRQAARNGAFVFNADTNRGDVTVADDREYAYEDGSGGLAEGGIIPDDREGYDTVEWDCKKVGIGARVTDEMVRHARVDIIERQIRHVGEVAENDINRIWLNELVDGAGETYNAGGADLGVPALNGAVAAVDENDFIPDTFVSHPQFRKELFDDSNLVFVQQSGQDTELRERELERVMGIDHLAMNNAAYDSDDTTWGYEGDGEEGAVVYQQEHMWLVIEQDIEIKDYEDPIRDLQGVNSRAWVDAVYAQPDAAATVDHGV